MQFSVFLVPDTGAVSLKNELIDFASANTKNDFTVNDHGQYVSTDYILNKASAITKFWVIRKEEVIIFGTYNCPKENVGKEDEIINEIVNSIL